MISLPFLWSFDQSLGFLQSRDYKQTVRLLMSIQWKLIHAQKFAHCGSIVHPVLHSRPCRTISQLGIPFFQDVKFTLHPCGAIVFCKFCNHARYRSICLASIFLCYMDFMVGIKHGNWKGKELIVSISIFFIALIWVTTDKFQSMMHQLSSECGMLIILLGWKTQVRFFPIQGNLQQLQFSKIVQDKF